MGEVSFCSQCGRLDGYCVCEIEVEYLEDSMEVFRVEYAFESITCPEDTVYRKILPHYE